MKSDYQKWFKKHCEKGKDNNNNEKGKQEEKINNNLRNYLSKFGRHKRRIKFKCAI